MSVSDSSGTRRARAQWSFLLACALSLSACQKHGSKDEGGAAEAGAGEEDGAAGGDDGRSAPAKDDRIPELSAVAVGLQPGYVEGALLYASWRAGAMQELLQSVPVSPREAKDIAEFGALLGVDPRVDNVLAHLGVDPQARVSMSVRPVVSWAAQVREAVDTNSAAMQELTGSGRSHEIVHEPMPPGVEPQVVERPIQLSAAARELDRKARSLGVHVRLHLPLAEPAKLDRLVGLMNAELHDQRWATTCAALGPTRACGGSSDSVVVLRNVAGGLQFDALVTFEGDYDAPDDEFRRALIQQALSVPAAANAPAVANLRGDAVALIDGPGVVTAMRAAAIARLVSSLRHEGSSGYGVERNREREDALRQLHETERMFEGMSFEMQLGGDRMLASARWLPSDYGRAHMAEVFALTQIDADVPSIAALCDGALICGRSRGVPDRSRFSSLATGVYAQPEQLERLMDRYEEEAASVLMLETWPNAIGTLAGLPGSVMDGPEALIVQNVVDVGSRLLGFGFSVRSLNQTRRSVTGDWVAYARTSAADLSAIRGFLQLGEVRMSVVSIPEVEGRVEYTPIPDEGTPGNLYAIFDPAAATGEWGWAVLADGDDRVRWLAGLAHDDGSVPLLYMEVGDLWRLVAAFEDGREELGFAQSWLSRRWARGQLGLSSRDGAPELRMAMGKLD